MVNNGGDWFPMVNNSGDNKVRVWCQGRIDRDIARERERERAKERHRNRYTDRDIWCHMQQNIIRHV